MDTTVPNRAAPLDWPELDGFIGDIDAHGMGLITHEAGMVVFVETMLIHPVLGLIKLEDTAAVIETG